jgi:hypothetical protein
MMMIVEIIAYELINSVNDDNNIDVGGWYTLHWFYFHTTLLAIKVGG